MKNQNKQFLFRQYLALIEQGHNHQAAISMLESSLYNQTTKDDLSKLANSFRDYSNNTALITSNNKENITDLNKRLSSNLFSQTLPRNTIIKRVLESQHKIQQQKEKLSTHLKRNLSYTLAIGVVGIVILMIVATKVFPLFVELFSGYGSELPALTDNIIKLLNTDNPLFYLVLAIPIVIIFFMSRIDKLLLKSAQASFLAYLPYASQISKRIERLSHLNMLSLFAHELTSSKNSQLLDDPLFLGSSKQPWESLYTNEHAEMLTLTLKLGTFDKEQELLCEKIERETIHSLENEATKLNALLYSIITIFVGLVVISIYLPIFKMGSAI